MVIVTGANGFIGSAIVWELNQAGIEDIICVDTIGLTERPGPLKNVKYSTFLSEKDLLEQLPQLKEQKITGIFHMGACSTTTETDEEYLRKNNTEYTQKLWNFSIDQNICFIYASSASIYGDGTKGFDDNPATATFSPMHGYGRSKAAFDTWTETQTVAPRSWYGLRFFNVFGPNEYHKGHMCSVVFKAFNQIKKTGSQKLFRSNSPDYKDGEQMRDFIYVKEVTKWMLELYQSSNVPSGIYNMGFGKARTWLDLVTAVFNALNKEKNIEWIDIPENLRNQYQNFTEAKMDKAFTSGLSKPEWPLEKAVNDYVNNYLKSEEPYL